MNQFTILTALVFLSFGRPAVASLCEQGILGSRDTVPAEAARYALEAGIMVKRSFGKYVESLATSKPESATLSTLRDMIAIGMNVHALASEPLLAGFLAKYAPTTTHYLKGFSRNIAPLVKRIAELEAGVVPLNPAAMGQLKAELLKALSLIIIPQGSWGFTGPAKPNWWDSPSPSLQLASSENARLVIETVESFLAVADRLVIANAGAIWVDTFLGSYELGVSGSLGTRYDFARATDTDGYVKQLAGDVSWEKQIGRGTWLTVLKDAEVTKYFMPLAESDFEAVGKPVRRLLHLKSEDILPLQNAVRHYVTRLEQNGQVTEQAVLSFALAYMGTAEFRQSPNDFAVNEIAEIRNFMMRALMTEKGMAVMKQKLDSLDILKDMAAKGLFASDH